MIAVAGKVCPDCGGYGLFTYSNGIVVSTLQQLAYTLCEDCHKRTEIIVPLPTLNQNTMNKETSVTR